jgi:hypothetical protein
MDAVHERRAGAGPIVLAFVAVFAAVAFIADADSIDLNTPVFELVIFGPFVVFGAIVARWWTLALPLACSLVYIATRWAVDELTGECSICSSDEDWGSYPIVFLVFGTVPVTLALLLGLALGAIMRR